jgi:hypothetical protein
VSAFSALVLAGAPAAVASPADDARAIRAGLERAVAAGRLSKAEAYRYRTIVRKTQAELRLLPGSRYTALARVLQLVRLQAGRYNRPRALALFSMLDHNAEYLSVRVVPPTPTDVVGADGVVYRAGWGAGLQFHPLANVGALNAHVRAGRKAEAAALARALVARAVRPSRTAVWEYYFPFGSGSPPWSSGMVQAVGAQALARAGTLLGEPYLAGAARRAYLAIPTIRLVRGVSTGPWIRLYSFSDLVVLNAQLQAALSLAQYARILADDAAGALARRLEGSAKGLFHQFDTGYWSNYTPGNEAPLKYHVYHVSLLNMLSRRTHDVFWADAAERFDRYTHEPPVFRRGSAIPVLYPWPADGFRDEARVRFWVSKISNVTVRIGGQVHPLGWSRRGWYAVSWRPGRRAPGVVRPVVRSVDLAGNRGEATLQPIRIAVDREPPEVTATVVWRRLTWRVVDNATPWVRMRVALERAGAKKTLVLGRQPLAGSLRLALPRGRWNAVLVVADSSGNRTRTSLGSVPARPAGRETPPR